MPADTTTHGDILTRIDGLETRFTVAIETVATELKMHGKEEAKTRSFLFGDSGGTVGVAELVRAHDRWIGTQRKLLFAMVPAILLGVAAVVWQTVVLALKANG